MKAAMATAAKIAYPHIERTPGVRAGKACIVSTRIAVVDVAQAHQAGLSPEEIQTHFSSRPLTLAEVHAALTYHYDHPEELTEYLHRGQQLESDVEKAKDEYVKRRGR
jgi:uncharacterized protein (DUF433 family)